MMKIEHISSLASPKFKIWQSLLGSKGLREEKLCLVSGKKIVSEVLKNKEIKINSVLLTDESQVNYYRHIDQAFVLSSELFSKLDVLGTHSPILVVAVPALQTHSNTDPSGLEVVIPLSDPSNVGALIRSCVAFGVAKIILTKESANPFLPKALRSSSGLSLLAPLFITDSINELARNALQANDLHALDMAGQDISKFKWPQNLRLIVGEEGKGLPDTLKYVTRLSIPINERSESLNAVVATSIALFSYKSQRG